MIDNRLGHTSFWAKNSLQAALALTASAGHYGYLGQFAPTIWALQKTLGDDQVFDKPSELQAKANPVAEPVAEPDEESVATEKKATVN